MNDMTEMTHVAESAELTESEAQALAKLNGRKSSRDLVYDAIAEMSDSEMPARTPDIVSVTGLSSAVVSDSIKELKRRGRIFSDNGQFLVSEMHQETQAVTQTILPSGALKVEKGDVVLDLTPREARNLFGMGGAYTQQAAVIVMDRKLVEQQSQIRRLQMRTVRMESEREESARLIECMAADLSYLKRELGIPEQESEPAAKRRSRRSPQPA